MEDRADIEVDGLQRTEGALDLSQALIRAHGGAGIEGLGRHGGAQDIEAVERRLGGDAGVIAGKRKIVEIDANMVSGYAENTRCQGDVLRHRKNVIDGV